MIYKRFHLGPMPQNAGDVTSGRACGNWYGNCCHFEVPEDIQVKNCGSYFIYRLESTPFCNTTYCAGVWYYLTKQLITFNANKLLFL